MLIVSIARTLSIMQYCPFNYSEVSSPSSFLVPIPLTPPLQSQLQFQTRISSQLMIMGSMMSTLFATTTKNCRFPVLESLSMLKLICSLLHNVSASRYWQQWISYFSLPSSLLLVTLPVLLGCNVSVVNVPVSGWVPKLWCPFHKFCAHIHFILLIPVAICSRSSLF